MKDFKGDPTAYEVKMEGHLDRVNSLGWGEMSFDEVDWIKGEMKLSLRNNSFQDYCGSGHDGMCYFIKAVMTGTMEEITHQSFSVTETECVKNGDEKCVFVLKRMS